MKKFLVSLIAVTLICGISNARQPQRGYRGFLDWSNNLKSEKFEYVEDGVSYSARTNFFYTGVSTSHGYQFNPHLFVGAGLDIEYNNKLADLLLAPFVHARTDLQFGKFTPFADARLGYGFRDGGGIYFSPNIGYRFNWGRKMGVNLGLGLTLLGYNQDLYSFVVSDAFFYDEATEIVKENFKGCRAFFSFRIGIDF